MSNLNKHVEEWLELLNKMGASNRGKGSLKALNYIKEMIDNDYEKENVEKNIRVKIQCLTEGLQTSEIIDNIDFIQGELDQYKYCYFKLLVDMGLLSDENYSSGY